MFDDSFTEFGRQLPIIDLADKSLPEPMVTQFIDAYMRQQNSMN